MKKQLEVKVPKVVTDIRLGQYQEYVKLISGMGDDIKYNEFLKMKLVSIFCDVPMELVRTGFRSRDVDSMSATIVEVLAELEKDTKNPLKPIHKIRGTEFGVEPDFENMSAGAFADLTEYFGKPEQMHRVLAVLLRPIEFKKRSWYLKIEQYSIKEYTGTDKYAELMRFLPAIIALQVNFYFSNSFIQLRRIFLTYMGKKALESPNLSTALKTHSMTDMDGIKLFTQLEEVM